MEREGKRGEGSGGVVWESAVSAAEAGGVEGFKEPVFSVVGG